MKYGQAIYFYLHLPYFQQISKTSFFENQSHPQVFLHPSTILFLLLYQLILLPQLKNLMSSLNNPQIYFICISAAIILFMLITLIYYCIKYKSKTITILGLLSILVINQLFQSIFETIGAFNISNNLLCIASLIATLFFTIAGQFWMIFITRLIYKEAVAPGKFFNMVKFFYHNILITYAPSLVFSMFLFIILMASSSKAEDECWIISQKQEVLDQLGFFISFILPKLISFVTISVYLFQYQRLVKKWTNYLLLPIIANIFAIYYLAVKIYIFFHPETNTYILEIPLLAEPLLFTIMFIYFCSKYSKNNKRIANSDLTIDESDIHTSFVEDL